MINIPTEQIPIGVKYITVDEGGDVFCHYTEPDIISYDGMWVSDENDELLCTIERPDNWTRELYAVDRSQGTQLIPIPEPSFLAEQAD